MTMRRSDLYSGSDKISIESEALHMDLRSENAFENVLHALDFGRIFENQMSSPTPPLYLVFCCSFIDLMLNQLAQFHSKILK